MTPQIIAAVKRDIEKLTAGCSPSQAATLEAAVWFNCRTWNEFLGKDPELARIEIGIAWCARIEQTSDEGSPQRAEAMREDRKLRDQRHALWLKRAEAAKTEVPF